jgi:hypothetical protein
MDARSLPVPITPQNGFRRDAGNDRPEACATRNSKLETRSFKLETVAT